MEGQSVRRTASGNQPAARADVPRVESAWSRASGSRAMVAVVACRRCSTGTWPSSRASTTGAAGAARREHRADWSLHGARLHRAGAGFARTGAPDEDKKINPTRCASTRIDGGDASSGDGSRSRGGADRRRAGMENLFMGRSLSRLSARVARRN